MRILPFMRLVLAIPVLIAPAQAQSGAPSPTETGVLVEKPAGDGKLFSHGSGIFLGDSLVLTAAHVVAVDPRSRRVTVQIDGRLTSGIVVFDGKPQKLDLALIKIDTSVLSNNRRAQPPVPVCAANPGTDQPVAVAAQGAVTDSATISTPITSDGQSGTWTNLLTTGFHQGNSGGGVFSKAQKCLWGVISYEMGGTVDGRVIDITAFVPASDITRFLRSYYSSGH